MSIFETVDTVVKLALLPHELGDISTTIRKKMNALLFVFSSELQAIPVLYEDISFPDNMEVGRVIAEMPWIHVDVSARLLTFNPSPGKVISGKVKMVSIMPFLDDLVS